MSREKRKLSEDLERDALPPVEEYLSTGSTILDLAIADRFPGGIGVGRVTHIYGPESTAKSVLAQEVLGAAQRQGGYAVYEDSEMTLDLQRAQALFGLKTGSWREEGVADKYLEGRLSECLNVADHFAYRVPRSIEALWDEELADLVQAREDDAIPAPVAVAVDTFSAIPSEAELKAEMTDGTYGTSRAKQMSTGFRKWLRRLSEARIAVVAVDQIRDNVGVQWGDKTTVSGGRAMKFYASTRVQMTGAKPIKNKNDRIYGVKIGFKVKKNKVGPPFREGLVRILFDYGIDDVTSNVEWLSEQDVLSQVEKKGAWWSFADIKQQGLEKLVCAIEDAGLEDELRQEVVRVWAIVHEAPKRKVRER